MSTKVLILMPLLNESEYVEDALKSILLQTFQDYTVVAQDNKSDDFTSSKIANLAKIDSRFHIWETDTRLSQAHNWKSLADLALEKFRSEYVIWMGGDDIWISENFLSNLIAGVDETCCAVSPLFLHSVISGGYSNLDPYPTQLHSVKTSERINCLLSDWRNVNAIHALYKREFFEAVLKSPVGRPFDYLGFDWWWVFAAIQMGPIAVVDSTIMDKRIKNVVSLGVIGSLTRFQKRNLIDVKTMISRSLRLRSIIGFRLSRRVASHFFVRFLISQIKLPAKSWQYFVSKH